VQLAAGSLQRSNAAEQRQAGLAYPPAAAKKAGIPVHCHSPSPLLLCSSSRATSPARGNTLSGKPGIPLCAGPWGSAQHFPGPIAGDTPVPTPCLIQFWKVSQGSHLSPRLEQAQVTCAVCIQVMPGGEESPLTRQTGRAECPACAHQGTASFGATLWRGASPRRRHPRIAGSEGLALAVPAGQSPHPPKARNRRGGLGSGLGEVPSILLIGWVHERG